MRFRGEYYFLSNMSPSPITMNIDGKTCHFTCAEAAFQAHKCPWNPSLFENIDGYVAKKLGRSVGIKDIAAWNTGRIEVMKQVVARKFLQNPDLAEKLKSTMPQHLVEDNTWDDTFWGICNGQGENHLGQILEEIRGGLVNGVLYAYITEQEDASDEIQ